LYQERQDCLIIKVVTGQGFSDDNKATLIQNARENTSNRMQIVVEEVDGIRRGPNGKFQSIVNKLMMLQPEPVELMLASASAG
jgi:hypothetical protein